MNVSEPLPLDAPAEIEQASWARLVSNLFSPPLVWAAAALPIALRDASTPQQGLGWALVYIGLVCLLPLAFVAWMVQRGSISDLHMQVRRERLRPFVVSLLCALLAWWALGALAAPPVMRLFALFSVVQIAIMAGVTLVWQISMHTMSISGSVVAAGAFFGAAPALAVLPLVLLVSAARLRLRRHTIAQVLAGAAVGVLVPVALFAAL